MTAPSGNARHEAGEPAFGVRLSAVRDVPRRDLAIRFAFGAGISTAAAIIGLAAGARIGGVFLAFPAILPATLTLLEKEDSKRTAENDDVGSILGAAALAVFGVVTWLLVRHDGAPVGLVAAAVAWLGTAVALYLSLRAVVRRRERHGGGRGRQRDRRSSGVASPQH
jgi:uncharacterized membrane protein